MKKRYPRSGPDVNPWRLEAEAKNTGVLSSPAFIKACKAVGIEPNRRQASKFRKGRGLAYQKGRVNEIS